MIFLPRSSSLLLRFAPCLTETRLNPGGERRLFCFNVPTWSYPFVLVVLISAVMPSVSFLGHFLGICAGYGIAKGIFPCALPRRCMLDFERRNEDSLLPNLSRYIGPYIKCPERSPFAEGAIALPCMAASRASTETEEEGESSGGSALCMACTTTWQALSNMGSNFITRCSTFIQRTRSGEPAFGANRYDPVEMQSIPGSELSEDTVLDGQYNYYICS